MTNIVGYNLYPDREKFIALYSNGYTQLQLAELYKCGKFRIRKWIKYFNLEPRQQGGGNNKKYSKHQIDQLKILYESGASLKYILYKTKMKSGSIWKYVKLFGLKRPDMDKYKKYILKVRRLTEKNYVKWKDTLNPENYPRTLCGVNGGYQLDHILSIRECFIQGISEEKCAAFSNLEFVPWEENLKRRKKLLIQEQKEIESD